jgi:DNA-binding response OmpR family regulator
MAAGRILILEDEPSIAAMYAEVLRAAGNDVSVHTSFEEARTELKHEVPDGLLADVRVKSYNGLHLALLYRSLSPEGVILVVSGLDDPVIRKEAAAIQAEFLVKPIEFSRLTAHFAKLPDISRRHSSKSGLNQ